MGTGNDLHNEFDFSVDFSEESTIKESLLQRLLALNEEMEDGEQNGMTLLEDDDLEMLAAAGVPTKSGQPNEKAPSKSLKY